MQFDGKTIATPTPESARAGMNLRPAWPAELTSKGGLIGCCESRSAKLLGRPELIMQPQQKRPLYDRVGGVDSVAMVVDDFIDRIMVDPRLNANPLVDEARHRVPPAGSEYLVTEMVRLGYRWPQKYRGEAMPESHAHLKITAPEGEAFLDDFGRTPDRFAVPAQEQAELKAIVNRTRSDIVLASDAAVA
jgi:hemoglobin